MEQSGTEQNGTKQNEMVQNRIYNNHLVQLLDHIRSEQKLKHTTEGIVLMPLGQWQASGLNHFSRKPVPVFGHPLRNKMLSNVKSEPPFMQLWSIAVCPVTGYKRGDQHLLLQFLSSGSCREQWFKFGDQSDLQAR